MAGITSYLSLNDLFLVGLALDISGAVLLAKGLLLSPRELSRLNTWWGVAQGQHRDRCRNRVDGRFGLWYLGVGFALQAVGYSLEVGGAKAATGADRLLAAFLMAALATGVAWTAWWSLHESQADALAAAVESEREAAAEEIKDGEARKLSS